MKQWPAPAQSFIYQDVQRYAGALHAMTVAAMLAVSALQPPASLAGVQEAGALEAESSMEVLRGPSPDIPTQFPPLPDIVMPDIEEVPLAVLLDASQVVVVGWKTPHEKYVLSCGSLAGCSKQWIESLLAGRP